jgi:hypothetical protein
METVLKTYLGFFFLMTMLFVGAGMLSASLDARNANAMANNYATRIEQSNYASSVIQEIKLEAQKLGYTVSVDVRTSANNTYSHYGLLTLRYNYRIPIIGIAQTHSAIVDLN